MRNSDVAWRVAALISALCFSGACALSRLWVLAVLPMVLVVLRLVSKNPGRGFREAFVLSASAAFAVLGMHLQLSVLLLLIGTAAALAAWDLAHFAQQLTLAVSDDQRARLQRVHLPSLVVATASGLGFAILASVARLHLPFSVVSVLAIILVLSLTRIPREIRAKSENS